MTAKEYLQQYLDADQRVTAKLEELSRLRSLACRTTSAPSGDRVQSGGDGKLEHAVERMVELEQEINAEIDTLIDIRQRVRRVIERVPDKAQRDVLRYRYIAGMRWEEIAVRMHYTYRNVCYLHGKALQVVAKKIS